MVLDYIIDVVAGTFILLLLFIGENKVSYSLLYQRILFCCGALLYGILIPIAHLLNESRVRNIIVRDGWHKGFMSIFHSEKKIRQFQRKQNIQMKWKSFLINYACHDFKAEKFLLGLKKLILVKVFQILLWNYRSQGLQNVNTIKAILRILYFANTSWNFNSFCTVDWKKWMFAHLVRFALM